MTDVSYVYFIGYPTGEEYTVKVGYAKSPIQRMLGIQSSNPELLHLYGMIPVVGHQIDASSRERELHARLKKYSIRGEWFRLPHEVLLDELSCGIRLIKPVTGESSVKERTSLVLFMFAAGLSVTEQATRYRALDEMFWQKAGASWTHLCVNSLISTLGLGLVEKYLDDLRRVAPEGKRYKIDNYKTFGECNDLTFWLLCRKMSAVTADSGVLHKVRNITHFPGEDALAEFGEASMLDKWKVVEDIHKVHVGSCTWYAKAEDNILDTYKQLGYSSFDVKSIELITQ